MIEKFASQRIEQELDYFNLEQKHFEIIGHLQSRMELGRHPQTPQSLVKGH